MTRGLAVSVIVGAAVITTALAISTVWDIRVRREYAESRTQGDCADPKDCGLESLHADIRAAIAAEDIVDLAVWQLLLGVVGLVGVGFTIFYARLAWREAQRSTDGAERMNRPHIHVQNIELSGLANRVDVGPVKDACEFRLQFQNYGGAPGFVTRWWIIPICLPEVPANPTYETPLAIDIPVPVGDGFRPSSGPLYMSLDEAAREQLRSGERKLLVWGYVEYDDLSRLPHRTRFIYQLVYKPTAPDGGRLLPVTDAPAYWEHT